MLVTSQITADLTQKELMQYVYATQDDSNTRAIEITLTANGAPWDVPTGVTGAVSYKKPDKTAGLYDTLPDGATKAVTISGNKVTATLAPQVLTVAGDVDFSVALYDANLNKLGTFPITLRVQKNPATGHSISNNYFYLTTLAAVNEAIGDITSLQTSSRDSLVSAINELVANLLTAELITYTEANGVARIENGVDAYNEVWKQWNERLALGMNTETAPVPLAILGQLFVDGTIIAHNTKNQNRNRWGFHVLEAYAKDNYSRATMLLDKHASEANEKPSLEFYYYIGAGHEAFCYGNTKIGSDVKYHSFCFDRDKMTAYGEIDSKMPITLARISLANDISTEFETVKEADKAYKAEQQAEENNKCLKYIALKNADNGAMFYDTDRNKVVVKVNGAWCDLPTEIITDRSFAVLGQEVAMIPCESVSLSESALAFTAIGAKVVDIHVEPVDTTDNVEIISSNPEIAIYANGAVYALGNGDATITVKCGAHSASCNVSIRGINESSLVDAEWKNGLIYANGSWDEVSNRLITTGYIHSGVRSITALHGYEFAVCCFDDNGVASEAGSYYNFNSGALSKSADYRTSADLTNMNNTGFENIRLICRRTDGDNITPTEGKFIVLSTVKSVAWKNGLIYANGSWDEVSNRLITTGYIDESAISISANEGYEFAVTCFADDGSVYQNDAGTNCAYYKFSSNSLSAGADYRTSADLTNMNNTGFENIRLICRRTDGADISPDEGASIIITYE